MKNFLSYVKETITESICVDQSFITKSPTETVNALNEWVSKVFNVKVNKYFIINNDQLMVNPNMYYSNITIIVDNNINGIYDVILTGKVKRLKVISLKTPRCIG